MLLGGKAILIVEDEILIAGLIEGMLQDLGCPDVTTASDLKGAFAAIGKYRFDAVILDMNLAGVSCAPVSCAPFAETLEKHAIPFVFSTGYMAPASPHRWEKVPLLQKPYFSQDIEAALAKVLPK